MKNAALCAGLLALAIVGCLLIPWLFAGCVDGTAIWPTWTPLPTNTPRVYPSWTPVPTATSRRSATPTATATPAATRTPTEESTPLPTATATAHVTPEMPPTLPEPPTATPTLPSCSKPWPFTYNEILNIHAAAANASLSGHQIYKEPPTLPLEDEILAIGWFAEKLGAAQTDEYVLLADDDVTRIRCRAFALGIVAIMECERVPSECQRWAVIGWDGEVRP